MEDRQKIIEKLVKIKALAERGVGGEQQTAQQMYEALKKRYGITDEEVNRAAVPVDISEIDLKKILGYQLQNGADCIQPKRRTENVRNVQTGSFARTGMRNVQHI